MPIDIFEHKQGMPSVEPAIPAMNEPKDLFSGTVEQPTFDSQLQKYTSDDIGLTEDEKLLIGQIFTPEELEEIGKMEPAGFMETLKGKGYHHMLPYVGTGEDIGEGAADLSMINKAKDGDLNAINHVKQMLKEDMTQQMRGTSIGGKIGNILHYAPAFMGEMAVAAATFGTGAAPKAAQVATTTAVKAGTKTVAKNILKKTGKGTLKSGAVAAGMVHHLPKNYLDRRIAGSIQITDKGEALLQDMEEAPATTAIKALGDVWVEVASEMSGGVITKGISKVAAPVTKAIGKSASPVMNKALSGVPAKVKDAVFRTVKKFKPDANISRMLSDKVYFNGIIGEIGEERWAGVLKTALGLDDREIPTADKYMDAIFPDKEQLLAEIGAFSMMGASSHAAVRAYNGLMNKGFSPAQATQTLETMTETQKEDLAKKIGFDKKTIIETVEVPVEKIKLSSEIPNFKEGANENGVVAGEALQGKYDRLGSAPIVLWERNNGNLEIITGRHRLDLAKRTGEATIPSQIVKESDGYTAAKARIFDVEQNIKDEKGSVKDYARYFKETTDELTEEDAKQRGLLGRSKGRTAFKIARDSTDALYALFLNGKISDAKAAAIASGAPTNEAAQAAGIKASQKLSAEELKAFVSILNTPSPTQANDGDLFGFDDSKIKETESIAKLVAKDKAMIDAKISAVRGALKNPKVAEDMGLKFEATPENIGKEVEKLLFEKDQLDKFSTNPALMQHYRDMISGKEVESPVVDKEKQLKDWFEDSKIVDEKGNPKHLYHGTNANWQVFELEKSSEYGKYGSGFYASDAKEIGDRYKGGVLEKNTENGHVLDVYVKMKKPYMLDEKISDIELAAFKEYNENAGDGQKFFWKHIVDNISYDLPRPNDFYIDEGTIDSKYINRKDLTTIRNWLWKNDKDFSGADPKQELTRDDVYYILTDGKGSIRGKRAINKIIKGAGFDGYVVSAKGSGLGKDGLENLEHNIYVVFDKFQIKSVDSNFTKGSPNIFEDAPYKRYMPAYTPENKALADLASKIPSDMVQLAERHNIYAHPFLDREVSKMQEFHRRWTDYLEPLREISESTYKRARLFAGVGGKIAITISDYTENMQGQKTGEGLLPIINDFKVEFGVRQKTVEEDLGGYMIAKRYADLAARKDVKITEEQLQQSLDIMGELQNKYGDNLLRFEHYAERIYDYQKRVSKLLVESGLMSQKAYTAMIEKNPHYVPFYRILDENKIQNDVIEKNARGKGFLKARPTIKKIKGSDLDIRNPFASIVNNTASIITNAYKNEIVSNVARLRTTHKDLVKEKVPDRASFDKGLRDMLKLGAKKLGVSYERTDKRLSADNAFGVYLPFENKIREKIGVDAALAHEFGHALDDKLGLGHYILQDEEVEKELMSLAVERIGAVLSENDGRFNRTIKAADESYKIYIFSAPELIANLYDASINAPELLKAHAPRAKALLEQWVADSKHEWLKDIHRTLDVGFETMYGEMDRAENIISYYKDGQKKYIEVHRDLYDSLKGVDAVKLPFVVSLLTKYPATLLRWGATQANITFALVRNPLRDTFTASMQTKVGFIPVYDTLKGAGNVLLKTDAYKEWKMQGGSFDSFMQINENSKRNPYKEIFESGASFKQLNPFWWVEKAGQLFEEGTRVGVYNKAIKKGLSKQEGAFVSRDSTIDFARGGKVGKQINQFIPFFNANIQGLVSMTEKFKKNPVRMVVKALAELTIPSVALAYYYTQAAPDDERKEYAEIPTWRKNAFWNIKIAGEWITIPKPFSYGAVFATLPQALVEGITTDQDIDWLNQSKNIFDNLNFIGDVSSALPPLVKVALELQSNTSFYTGQDIIPAYLIDVEPSEQYNDRTSEIAKNVGKLGVSPMQADHVITSLGAGLMRDFLSFTDAKLNKNLPEKEMGEKPVLRGFIGKEAIGYNSQSVQKFMDAFKELEETYKTFKKIEKEDPDRADAYAEKHEQEIDLYEELKSFNKEIREISQEINATSKDEDLSPRRKKTEIRDLKKEMTSTAQEANEAIKDY